MSFYKLPEKKLSINHWICYYDNKAGPQVRGAPAAESWFF